MNSITIDNKTYEIKDYILYNLVNENGNLSRTKCIVTNFDKSPEEISNGFSPGYDKKKYKLTLNNESHEIEDVSYALLPVNKDFNTCIAFNQK